MQGNDVIYHGSCARHPSHQPSCTAAGAQHLRNYVALRSTASKAGHFCQGCMTHLCVVRSPRSQAGAAPDMPCWAQQAAK